MSTFKALPFQLNTAKSWNGLTREEHFTNIFGQEPHYIDNVVQQLFDVNVGTSLLSYINQFPTVEIPEDAPYRWRLAGREKRRVSLVGAWENEAGTAVLGTSNPRPGINGTRIFMDFPERYFTVTHVIIGNKPDLYHLRVMEEPVQVGKNWRYSLQVVTNEDAFFVPLTEFAKGSEWSIGYSLSEQTMSKDGSDIGFNAPFEMENSISMMRKRHVVPGNMIDKGKNKPLVFGFVHPETSKTTTSWIAEMDYQFLRQFNDEFAKLMYLGKSTIRADGSTTMKGGSGNSLRAGYGLRDQFLPSNRHYYTKMSVAYLTKIMLEASYNKIGMKERNFTIATGQWGLAMLHNMLREELSTNSYTWMQDSTGRAFSWKGNDITVKMGQFVGFATINGINVNFMYMPMYDDDVTNKTEHPDGGIAESYRLTIMDMGTKSNPNIQKVRIKGQSPAYTYISGLRDPFSKGGQGKPRMTVSEVDGYTINRADWGGIRVKDPTRIIECIPSILQF